MVASLLAGQTVTVYDLDLASRNTPRRHIFVVGMLLLCTVVSWLTQQVCGVWCATLHALALALALAQCSKHAS